jgi:spore germination cell wall hydrolase CwlJ-like protein
MIQGEEGVESREAKIAVGWVAINRMNANTAEFGGSTLYGVITKPNAFQGYKSSNVPSSQSLEVAKGILDGSIADNTNGALFFVNSANDITSIVSSCDPGYSKYGSLYAYHDYCKAAAAVV